MNESKLSLKCYIYKSRSIHQVVQKPACNMGLLQQHRFITTNLDFYRFFWPFLTALPTCTIHEFHKWVKWHLSLSFWAYNSWVNHLQYTRFTYFTHMTLIRCYTCDLRFKPISCLILNYLLVHHRQAELIMLFVLEFWFWFIL